MLGEPLLVVSIVVRVLEDLGVRYVVGGSVASSIYGEPRATQDADIVAELQDEHVDRFIAGLAGGFYADADMIRDAIRRRASFNVIHLATMFKVAARRTWRSAGARWPSFSRARRIRPTRST